MQPSLVRLMNKEGICNNKGTKSITGVVGQAITVGGISSQLLEDLDSPIGGLEVSVEIPHISGILRIVLSGAYKLYLEVQDHL
jgi:hypothetical protein